MANDMKTNIMANDMKTKLEPFPLKSTTDIVRLKHSNTDIVRLTQSKTVIVRLNKSKTDIAQPFLSNHESRPSAREVSILWRKEVFYMSNYACNSLLLFCETIKQSENVNKKITCNSLQIGGLKLIIKTLD